MRRIWPFLLFPIVMLWLTGCSRGREPITGLTFERGSGSVWGDQLYISITQRKITTLRYIPDGSGEQVERENLPITQQQWQAVLAQLEQLTLEKERTNPIGKLFGKQDGGDFRRLTITCGSETVTCRWPKNGQALESLLEQLVREVTG